MVSSLVVLVLLAGTVGPDVSDGGVVAAPDASVADAGAALDAGEADEDDDESADAEESNSAEAEDHEASGPIPGDGGLLYSTDVSDEQLRKLWKESPAALGSISVGFVDEGRLINAEPMPAGESWTVVIPEYAWGTHETMEYLKTAIRAVCAQFPGTGPLRVNHISKKEGGYLRPHESHQAGRDADLAFYYRKDVAPGARGDRIPMMDIPRNWALVKALATLTDPQVIIVDKRIQKVLYEYALGLGEDREWLDGLFRAGPKALVKHARHHRDHFHVRFYAPRSQELGRRVQPLLAQRPDQNMAFHRVRSGDTLGHLARRYGTTVNAIMKANRMRKTFLRLGQQVLIPLRGPCTQCPLPPPVVLPPRHLPPGFASAPAEDGGSPDAAASVDAGSTPDAAAPDGGTAHVVLVQ